MSSTRTRKASTATLTVLGIRPDVTIEDARSLGTATEDARAVASVAAHFVVSVQKAETVRSYAESTGISKSAIGRMLHVGAALVAIGSTATPADARNVTRVLNVLPASEVSPKVEGKSGRALAKVYATLAPVATKRIGERKPKGASTTPTKGQTKGAGDPTTAKRPTDVVSMLTKGIALLADPKFTGDDISKVEDALAAVILARANNRSGRTGLAS